MKYIIITVLLTFNISYGMNRKDKDADLSFLSSTMSAQWTAIADAIAITIPLMVTESPEELMKQQLDALYEVLADQFDVKYKASCWVQMLEDMAPFFTYDKDMANGLHIMQEIAHKNLQDATYEFTVPDKLPLSFALHELNMPSKTAYVNKYSLAAHEWLEENPHVVEQYKLANHAAWYQELQEKYLGLKDVQKIKAALLPDDAAKDKKKVTNVLRNYAALSLHIQNDVRINQKIMEMVLKDMYTTYLSVADTTDVASEYTIAHDLLHTYYKDLDLPIHSLLLPQEDREVTKQRIKSRDGYKNITAAEKERITPFLQFVCAEAKRVLDEKFKYLAIRDMVIR